MSIEAHNEALGFVKKTIAHVEIRVQELQKENPKYSFVMTEKEMKHTLTELGQGGVSSPPSDDAFIYDEAHPDLETIKNKELVDKLKEIVYERRVDRPSFNADSTRLRKIKQDLIKYGAEIKKKNPKLDIESEVAEAVSRINTLIYNAEQLSERKQGVISWDRLQEDYKIENSERKSGERFESRYLSSGEMEKILRGADEQGDDGLREVYTERTLEIYLTTKTTGKPGMPDEYWMDELEKFVHWVYGDKLNHRLAVIRDLWGTEGRRNGLIANISYAGGGTDKKLEGLAYMTPSDRQHEVDNYTWSNHATALYEQTMFSVAAKEENIYAQKLAWLREKNMYQPDLSKPAKEMDRGTYAKALEKIKETSGALTPEQMADYLEISQALNIVRGGAIIQDRHMLHSSELYAKQSKLQVELDDLRRSNRPEDQDRIQDLSTVLLHTNWQEYTANPNSSVGPDANAQLTAVAGMSPVEVETYFRLKELLKIQGVEDPPEWKLRAAVFSARRIMIGTGRAMTIAAKTAVMPALEYTSSNGRDTMPAAFCEQIVRLENIELFMHRFGMGGRYGEISRAMLDMFSLEEQGFSSKIKNLPEKLRDSESKEAHRVRGMWLAAREITGIPFTEMIRKNVLGTGFIFDGTTWRTDIAIMDAIQKKILLYKKEHGLGEGDIVDTLGLALQLAALGTDAKHIPERTTVLTRMLERTPSKFFQILSSNVDNTQPGSIAVNIRHRYGIGMGTKEGDEFDRLLGAAEIMLRDDKNLWHRKVDLGEKNGFDSIFNGIFDKLGIEVGSPKREQYRLAIHDMQEYVRKERGDKDKTSILSTFAKNGFPITLSTADFDWKDARFDFLSAYSEERRMVNDQLPKSKAMGMMFDLLFKPEYMSPREPLKTTLPKLKEFRDTIENWQPPGAAEKAEKMMARIFLTMNTNRALRAKNPLMRAVTFIPGGITLMKNLSEVDLRENTFVSKAIRGFGVIPGLKDIPKDKISNLPHTLGNAISYSVGAIGKEGPEYDEFFVEFLLKEMERGGNFIEKPEFLKDLRKEFHSGPIGRLQGVFRKYWWVVPAATITLAVTSALDEEKKKG